MSNFYDSTIIKNKTLDYQRQNDAKFKDLYNNNLYFKDKLKSNYRSMS